MADIVIRPSMKFIKAGYVCALLVVCAAVVVHYEYLVDRYPEQRFPIFLSPACWFCFGPSSAICSGRP